MYISSRQTAYLESIFSAYQLFMIFEIYLKIHDVINYFIILRFPFPFLLSMFVQKTMLSPPRYQSFFLCSFRKDKGPSEVDDTEDKCENTITIENGIPCDPLDTKGGHVNDAFMTEDERLTPL